MNKEKFLSLMPTQTIKDEDVSNTIEEQRNLIDNGNSFVSRLSINRYLQKKLSEFDIEERLNLFSTLSDADFVYTENELYFYTIDIDSFGHILKEKFNLENVYELDVLYLENLLNGKDITQELVDISDEDMRDEDTENQNTSVGDILERFVFQTFGMPMGDAPTLKMMLIVKKALLGSYLAEKNVEWLEEGKREIYDISVLF